MVETTYPYSTYVPVTRLFSAGSGLGSYTPSKNQISRSPFQLGVSPTPKTAAGARVAAKEARPDPGPDAREAGAPWSGNSTSSDLLF